MFKLSSLSVLTRCKATGYRVFALSLALALSACASNLLEDQPDLPPEQPDLPGKGAESTPQWVIDEFTIDAMVKSGGLIINWVNPLDSTAKKDASTRTTVGPVGVDPGTVNPMTEQERQQLAWQEQWDALKHGMEPLPYIYRKAGGLSKDYETDGVKVVYDWWWFDATDQTWKMKSTHEAAGVKLVVDRYWNYDPTSGWQHATGGSAASNVFQDITKWKSKIGAQARLIGFRTLYKEIDAFRLDYITYLKLNNLFFSGDMAKTLMLDDSDPQKAPTLMLHEMDTYLRSNYAGGPGEDRVFFNESVYAPVNISSVYFPTSGNYSADDSAKQITKFGKVIDGEKMLENYTYVLGQDSTQPSAHPEVANPKYSAVAEARGKLFEFYLGYINGVDPVWWGIGEEKTVVLDDMTLYVGELAQLNIITVPLNVPLVGMHWTSSNSDIALIVPGGMVYGMAEGEVIVKLRSNGMEVASCKVKVSHDPKAIRVKSVALNPSSLLLYCGEVYDHSGVSITPSNATYRTVFWRSENAGIASVDFETGRITAVSTGQTYIIATAGGVSTVCDVTVKNPDVVPEDITVRVGKFALIPYTTVPATASLVGASWISGDATIAEVAVANNMVKGIAVGETTLELDSPDGRQAKCTITVLPADPNDKEVEDIIIYGSDYAPASGTVAAPLTKLSLFAGETYDCLHAEVLPEDATFGAVMWVSEQKDIATVSPTGGVITALKQGKVNIVAVAGGQTKVCELTVEEITVTPATVTLKLGETRLVSATTTPYNTDLYGKAVWRSTDPTFAEVNATTGIVTAKNIGETLIYATPWDNASACKVTVISDVEIKIIPSTLKITLGSVHNKLEVKVTPSNSIDAAYTLSSEDADIVTVDEFGVLNARSEGTTKIFATTAGGKQAECMVTVQPLLYPVFDFTFGHPTPSSTLDITWGDPQVTIRWEPVPADMTDAALIAEIQKAGARVSTFQQSIRATPYYEDAASLPTGIAVYDVFESAITAGANKLDYQSGDIIINRYCSESDTPPATLTAQSASLAQRRTAYKELVTQLSDLMTDMAASPLWDDLGTDATNPLRMLHTFIEGLITYPSPLTDAKLIDRTEFSVAGSSGDRQRATISAGETSALFEYYFGYVPPPTPKVIPSVTVSAPPTPVYIGDTFTLTADVQPSNAANSTVTWSSDYPAIAGVSASGEVTAARWGDADITATTANAVSGSSTVTVESSTTWYIAAANAGNGYGFRATDALRATASKGVGGIISTVSNYYTGTLGGTWPGKGTAAEQHAVIRVIDDLPNLNLSFASSSSYPHNIDMINNNGASPMLNIGQVSLQFCEFTLQEGLTITGTLNVSGGTCKFTMQENAAISGNISMGLSGQFTMEGGTISSDKVDMLNSCTMTVTGGTFSPKKVILSNRSTLTIAGSVTVDPTTELWENTTQIVAPDWPPAPGVDFSRTSP
ncbi:hypothetical protein AGMMS49965_21710 [Bacteroidia bacterium]|nr:hypothetical protein AGMMS49965_21710 [Bacteroidia bacterium]